MKIKNIFFIHSIENGSKDDVESLLNLYSLNLRILKKKARGYKNFQKKQIDIYLKNIIENYNKKILNSINNLPIEIKTKTIFRSF